jgi:hypothetical protein
MNIDKDSFSSGQIGSKLWLARELENVILKLGNPSLKILCLGGWYGITNFILCSRERLNIESYRSLDIDPNVEVNADNINNFWEWQNWKFKAITDDANTYQYWPDDFNTVINTSVEHIETHQWYDNIPDGYFVVLQSNDMIHDDHSHNHQTLEEMVNDFPMSQLLYKGELLFEYPDWQFKRFMLIGKK